MPGNVTQNYQLNQWSKDDQVKMEDFNADNAKIDAAIKAVADARTAGDAALQTALTGKADKTALTAKCEIVAGTYVGDGSASRSIYLGRSPKAVFVCSDSGATTGDRSYYGGLALPGAQVQIQSMPVLSLTSIGFNVYYYSSSYFSIYSNNSGATLHYIAFF